MKLKMSRFFPEEEYRSRVEGVRARMSERGLDACLVSSPENIYYLCGLDHQGYFAYQLLVVPLEGEPILITRAMERAIVRDQVPGVVHVGYSDGTQPLPRGQEKGELILATPGKEGAVAGLEPWSTSYGVPVRDVEAADGRAAAPVRATRKALGDVGLSEARLGIEKNSSFLPLSIAEGLFAALPEVEWHDATGLVDDCRLIQSPRELKCTREAAALSVSMMLSAIAAAGPGVPKSDIMAAIYQTMFQRGGTYPGFVPLVRSTRTLEHEHGTWDNRRLAHRDILFLEMAGCIRRYHAPMGRLVFIGKAPARARRMADLCREAIERAAETIGPGVKAGEVYEAWQGCLDRAGLKSYRRHHCGYAVGIGYPPSWSGNGVPVGLRPDSDLELQPGMVFHLMSWLLRTGRGDSFLSDTVVVTEDGCELLTGAGRDLTVR